MPTYEYACADCSNQWEEIQKISESPTLTCPKCQKPTAKRQISGGNFILKGGGWYADLYSSSSNKKSTTEGEKKSATEGESKTPSTSGSTNGSSAANSGSGSGTTSSSSNASSSPANSTSS